jgi:hypothetical protein
MAELDPNACPVCERGCESGDHIYDPQQSDLWCLYALRDAGYRDGVGEIRRLPPETLSAFADLLKTALGIVIVTAREQGIEI